MPLFNYCKSVSAQQCVSTQMFHASSELSVRCIPLLHFQSECLCWWIKAGKVEKKSAWFPSIVINFIRLRSSHSNERKMKQHRLMIFWHARLKFWDQSAEWDESLMRISHEGSCKVECLNKIDESFRYHAGDLNLNNIPFRRFHSELMRSRLLSYFQDYFSEKVSFLQIWKYIFSQLFLRFGAPENSRET